jgi:hypothetical protein
MGLGLHIREADKKNTEDDWPKPISNALSKGRVLFCAQTITGRRLLQPPAQGYKRAFDINAIAPRVK